MTGNKRFIWNSKDVMIDDTVTGNQLEVIDITEIDVLVEVLNELHEELDYIKNSITEHIKHQKTELGQKALKEIIEDYNEWLLGHKEGFE